MISFLDNKRGIILEIHRCYSSLLLSKVLEWRNFGDSKNWGGYSQESIDKFHKTPYLSSEYTSFALRVTITQVALPILTSLALLELTVYSYAFIGRIFYAPKEKKEETLNLSLTAVFLP